MANNPETLKKYAEEHKEQIRLSAKKYRDSHKEKAREYYLTVRRANPEKEREKARKAYQKYKDKKMEYQRKYYKEVKEKFIQMYGGKCVCCGETTFYFLTIEHKLGQIRATKETGARAYRKAIQEYRPDLYEILCWNCNCAEGQLGYCPHNPTEIKEHKIHHANKPYNYTKEVDSLGRRYK